MTRNRGNRPGRLANTSMARSRSWMLASWTSAASSPHQAGRLRTATRLPASYPCDSFSRGLHRLAVDDDRAGRRRSYGSFTTSGTQNLPLPSPRCSHPASCGSTTKQCPKGVRLRGIGICRHAGRTGCRSRHRTSRWFWDGPFRVRRQQRSQFLPMGTGQIADVRFPAYPPA